MQRVAERALEVSGLARFLIGPESRFITGQAIGIDGGHGLPREAITAMRMVVNEVFGFMHWELACAAETRPGGRHWGRFYQALGAHGPDGFPLIRAIMSAEPPLDEEFEAGVRTVLAGIGLWRGERLPARAPANKKARARAAAVRRVRTQRGGG